MHRDLPTDVVNTLRAWAAAQPEILRLYIFGSRVRGIGGGLEPEEEVERDFVGTCIGREQGVVEPPDFGREAW